MEEHPKRRWSKRLAALVVLTILVVGAGIAYAVWTVGGSGSGTATATSAAPLTTSVATTNAELYPGITGANLYLTVNNSNPFPVNVSSVNANGPAVADNPACVTTGVSFTTQATSQVIPANGS